MTTDFVFSPIRLLDKLKSVSGLDNLKYANSVGMYIDLAVEVASEWSEDWDSDNGFGSSDFTFALQDFIERIIILEESKLKVEFNPYLSIVKI